MSFHWNLSSDEGEEEEEVVDELRPAFAATATAGSKPHPFSSVARAKEEELERHQPNDFSFDGNDNEVGEDDDDEVDEVDWEDADDEFMSTNGDLKPAANSSNNNNYPAQLLPVTIDLDTSATDDAEDSKKRKRPATVRRKRYRFQSLPSDMQSFLLNLHRAHLLAITSHALFLSKLSSDWEVLHMSHSLIPFSWLSPDAMKKNKSTVTTLDPAPTEQELKAFCTWFFYLVNHTEERRHQQRRANVAAGAPRRVSYRGGSRARGKHRRKGPLQTFESRGSLFTPRRLIRYCNYLSPTFDEDPQLHDEDESESESVWSSLHKVLLLVSMCRSMGWRTRFVTVADPMKCDLDEDHPILNLGFFDFFRSSFGKKSHGVDHGKANFEKTQQKAAKRFKVVSSKSEHVDVPNDITCQPTLGWVEILCCASQNGKADDGKPKLRWVHVDPERELVDQPDRVEWIFGSGKLGDGRLTKRRAVMQYAVAAEYRSVGRDKDLLLGQLVDVTPRYANSWTESLRARGLAIIINGAARTSQLSVDPWWTKTLTTTNLSFRNRAKQAYRDLVDCRPNDPTDEGDDDGNSKTKQSCISANTKSTGNGYHHMEDHDEVEHLEKEELQESLRQEPLPTSKAAFKSHPVYALASLLNSAQVLAPDAKSRMCGVFKGELVYRRSDVTTALSTKKWMYNDRKVIDSELSRPIRTVKQRRKPTPKGFQALKSYGVGASNDGSEESRARDLAAASKLLEDDGMESLYAIWQTAPWSPDPVGPDDDIPTNEFNNVELELINPGLVHVNELNVAKVAKKLGIPYAPCLLGFEGQGGNRVPVIRGIVVHEHNEQLLREAQHEFSSHTLEQEEKKRRDAVFARWKRLIVGVLTKQRLEQAYKDDDDDDDDQE